MRDKRWRPKKRVPSKEEIARSETRLCPHGSFNSMAPTWEEEDEDTCIAHWPNGETVATTTHVPQESLTEYSKGDKEMQEYALQWGMVWTGNHWDDTCKVLWDSKSKKVPDLPSQRLTAQAMIDPEPVQILWRSK